MYTAPENKPSQEKKLLQELNINALRKKNENTIFYIWHSNSGELQASVMFKELFGITPKNIDEARTLIHEDDLIDLESRIKENTDRENIVMLLRMKAKNQDYTLFLSSFMYVDENIIGTLEPISFNLEETKKEFTSIAHERKSFALEAAKAGIWDWDITTNNVYYDSKYLTMLDYSLSNFSQTFASWADKVHRNDYDKTIKEQLRHIENPEAGNIFSCKYRFRTANGSYIWIFSQGKIVKRDASGKALRVIGLNIDVTEEEEAKIQLRFIANHDPLTGLHSRSHFDANFPKNDLTVLPAAYILVDADCLKMVNDCVSHAAGDLMLQKLARSMRFAIRSSDLLARIGGDEFAIFLPHTKEQNAQKVVEKIYASIESTNERDKSIITCASVGLACATTVEELDSLATRADIAMFEQKRKQKEESLKKTKVWIDSLEGKDFAGYKDKRVQS